MDSRARRLGAPDGPGRRAALRGDVRRGVHAPPAAARPARRRAMLALARRPPRRLRRRRRAAPLTSVASLGSFAAAAPMLRPLWAWSTSPRSSSVLWLLWTGRARRAGSRPCRPPHRRARRRPAGAHRPPLPAPARAGLGGVCWVAIPAACCSRRCSSLRWPPAPVPERRRWRLRAGVDPRPLARAGALVGAQRGAATAAGSPPCRCVRAGALLMRPLPVRALARPRRRALRPGLTRRSMRRRRTAASRADTSRRSASIAGPRPSGAGSVIRMRLKSGRNESSPSRWVSGSRFCMKAASSSAQSALGQDALGQRQDLGLLDPHVSR